MYEIKKEQSIELKRRNQFKNNYDNMLQFNVRHAPPRTDH